VTRGAKLENLILRVGPAWKATKVSGKVVRQKGEAVAGARISIFNGHEYVRSVEADKNGSFSFELYGDFKYAIEARVYGEHAGTSDRVSITDKSTDLTLVLKQQ
jgi:Carboxypeptidase regulatory-like domain